MILQHLTCLLDVVPKTKLSPGLARRKNSFNGDLNDFVPPRLDGLSNKFPLA